MPDTTIDLDAEAILFDGHWYTRDDLARRIKAMLDAGDFNVTRPSQALEHLTHTMASVRTVAFRATPDIVEALNKSAATAGKTVGNRIRELLSQGLGMAHEPSSAGPPAPPMLKPSSSSGGGSGGGGGGGGGSASSSSSAPTAPQVPMAGPGALRSAGMNDPNPSTPSVVVEPSLVEADEDVVELTDRKKTDEGPAKKNAESRWFNS